MADERVSVSIVSHRHGALVRELLKDLERCCPGIEVQLTLNVPEELPFAEGDFGLPLRTFRNADPAGFGANHNAAFARADGGYFCVLNPDIRVNANPFPALTAALEESKIGVAAPRIVNPGGATEDSARRFPTPWTLLRKAFTPGPHHDYEVASMPLHPEWVAGMFMLFRSAVYREIGGFDERYFLYYEDVDLCRRLRARGYEVSLVPSVSAVHDARRQSRHSLFHLRQHLASMFRFFVLR